MGPHGVPGACWHTWEHGTHARVSVRPGAPAALSVRARSSVQGDAGPWGCRCARCGCTPGPGEQWVWGQLPGWWVQAGWGWVTVISCPQAAAVVSCRCRGEGAGEQAGLPGGCWAPPGAGIVAAVCTSPRVSAVQGWGGCSRGDAGRFLGGSLLHAHGGVGEWAVHQCWTSLLSRGAGGTQESPKLSD